MTSLTVSMDSPRKFISIVSNGSTYLYDNVRTECGGAGSVPPSPVPRGDDRNSLAVTGQPIPGVDGGRLPEVRLKAPESTE